MEIYHKETKLRLGANIKIADTFWSRLLGLMFIKEMKGFDGLMIRNCNSIHNCFVRFPIDAIFLTDELKVVKILRGFKPWRFSWLYLSAKHVLELPAGTVGEEVKKGDFLEALGV